MLASRYGWTPQQVDALDPDFVEELKAFLGATEDVGEIERKRAEAKARRGR